MATQKEQGMDSQKEQGMDSQKTTCAECGATIDVPDGWSKIECSACGASLLIERKAPRRQGRFRRAMKKLFWAAVILIPVMLIWPDPPQNAMIIATGLVLAMMVKN